MSSRVGRGWLRVGDPRPHSMSTPGPRSPVWAGGSDDRAYKWLVEGPRAASQQSEHSVCPHLRGT